MKYPHQFILKAKLLCRNFMMEIFKRNVFIQWVHICGNTDAADLE